MNTFLILCILGILLADAAPRWIKGLKGAKRGSAIPAGTKRGRKPRKTAPEPPAPGPALPMD